MQRNWHTYCCNSVHVVHAQKKCHLAETAYQNVTNIKVVTILLCHRYSLVYKGEYSREICFTHENVMMKSVLMVLVNPLMVFSGLYV